MPISLARTFAAAPLGLADAGGYAQAAVGGARLRRRRIEPVDPAPVARLVLGKAVGQRATRLPTGGSVTPMVSGQLAVEPGDGSVVEVVGLAVARPADARTSTSPAEAGDGHLAW